jgi:pilus assembly protein Flp/PilA
MKSSNKKHEKGQGLVEYALILVLVAIVVIGTLTILGPSIGNVFSSINNSLTNAGGAQAAAPAPIVDPTACNAAKTTYLNYWNNVYMPDQTPAHWDQVIVLSQAYSHACNL